MKKIYALLLSAILGINAQAQMDGVEYQKVQPSPYLKEYNIAYFDGHPAIGGSQQIKTEYPSLYYALHVLTQPYMSEDSLLSANDIANQQAWYTDFISRRRSDLMQEDFKKQLGYEFDQKLRGFVASNFNQESRQRYLSSAPKQHSGKFATWSGSADQFEIKKVYDDFLSSKVLSKAKKDLASFALDTNMIYVAYGAIGNYDFNTQTIQLIINAEYIDYSKVLEGKPSSNLLCSIPMDEKDAQSFKERKYFRALIPVKPIPLEISTMINFIKSSVDNKKFRTELNGDSIEIIDNRNAEDKIMSIDVRGCVTR